MSETTTPAPVVNDMTEEDARPWHGTENPLEAMFQWIKAEIAALKRPISPAGTITPSGTVASTGMISSYGTTEPPFTPYVPPAADPAPIFTSSTTAAVSSADAHAPAPAYKPDPFEGNYK